MNTSRARVPNAMESIDESFASSSVELPQAPPSRPSLRRSDAGGEDVRIQRPRRAAPADAVRPTRAEVNLANLRHNFYVAARHAEAAQVWPVLKADGYGHGAPAVARTLERAGARGFCVALLEEAVELREAGIQAPILVMGGYYGGAYEELAAHDLVPVVYDPSHLEGLVRAAHRVGRAVRAHVKIDTGMARLGVRPADVASFAERLAARPEIVVDGLMTHLACADATDATDAFTGEQIARFEAASALFRRMGVSPRVRHAANSAALLRHRARFDAVRPGIAIFGASPIASDADLHPVMRVRTEIVGLRTIEAGESVGYGALFRASRRTVIATVPMGYADGLSRQLSNRGHMLVGGRRAPIVGAVSMDMSMLDITDVPSAALGAEVVVLGAQDGPHGKDAITVDEVASHAGTIAWEVLTSISRRVPRFYREP